MSRPRLTQARVAALAKTLFEGRATNVARNDGEWSVSARISHVVRLEGELLHLVLELAGYEAMKAVQEALEREVTADDVAAARQRIADRAARAAAYIAMQPTTGAAP
jgi:hypothetical protein